MTGKQIDCDVICPQDKRTGEFANAFRILRDSGREWFLDFLVYSATEQKATLVARIRVLEEFLPAIRDRLNMSLVEAPTELVSVAQCLGPDDIQ